MIKAITFSYAGGPRQGSEIVIDDEKNIDARIEALCHRGVRHYEHTEPKEVPLEKINMQQLTARDIISLVKLGVQEQYNEQFSRFMKGFEKDSAMSKFQLEKGEKDKEDLTLNPKEVEEILADFAQLYDDYTSGRVSVDRAVGIINQIKFIRYLDVPIQEDVDESFQEEASELVSQNISNKLIFQVKPTFTIFKDDECKEPIGTILSVDESKDEVVYEDDATKEHITVKLSEIQNRVLPF